MVISNIKKQAQRAFRQALNVGKKLGKVKTVTLIRSVDVNDSVGNLVSRTEKEYYQEAFILPVTEKDRELLDAGIAAIGEFMLVSNPIYNNPVNDPTWVILEQGDRIKTLDIHTHEEIIFLVKTIIGQESDVLVDAVLRREQ